MSNILITGGAGFIGTNLKVELRSRGHDVSTVDIIHSPDAKHYRVDTGEYQQLGALFKKCKFDFVYHLAAEYGRWNGEDHYANLWKTNCVGTKNILRLQEQHKFKQIFFSSAEVYGDYNQIMSEAVMDELPIRQMNDYAISKWAGEMQCLNHAAMFGVDIVRVRPVGCYGPHEYYNPYRGVIPIFVYKALHGQPFSCHRGHTRIFDYVTDTVKTFANIIDNFIPGEVYNVGGREEWAINIEQLAEIVLEATGASRQLLSTTGKEGFTTITKVVDFSKARRDLKHNPQVDTTEGVNRYVKWCKKVYEIN